MYIPIVYAYVHTSSTNTLNVHNKSTNHLVLVGVIDFR